jgi:hypothetical protein
MYRNLYISKKGQLAQKAGIAVHQVTTWLINMRKQKWDPASSLSFIQIKFYEKERESFTE